MGDRQLIELVKQYEAIYNVKSSEYRDTTLRSAAWDEVAKQLGKPIEECKEHWNKLRNCYNNAMKRRLKKIGKNIPQWRLEKQMSFLKPHMKGCLAIGNDNENCPSSPGSPCSDSQPYPESVASYTSNHTLNVPYNINPTPINDNNHLAEFVELMRGSQENRNKRQEMDDLDAFFISISKTVKKLPKHDQIRIKMDLLKTVSEAELKQLESQQNEVTTNQEERKHNILN